MPVSPGIAIGPVWSASVKDYSNNPDNPVVLNPIEADVEAGAIADFGGTFGVSDLSGTGGKCAGYTLSVGPGFGKYLGAQITFRQSQDQAKSIFNPLRYIDGVSVGIGGGVALPAVVSRGL